jgi:hypothetical protein
MTTTKTNEVSSRKPLRLWPGVAAAALLVLVGYVTPIVMPQYAGFGMIGAVGCALIVLLWWLLFSRARWYERVGAIALMIVALFAEKYVVHPFELRSRNTDVERGARRLGGREPTPRGGTSQRRSDRRAHARVLAVDAPPDRRHRRQRALGLTLAVVKDSRGTVAGPGRR